jgi:hypothetical protein
MLLEMTNELPRQMTRAWYHGAERHLTNFAVSIVQFGNDRHRCRCSTGRPLDLGSL